jgi:transcriptional regulator PpsR
VIDPASSASRAGFSNPDDALSHLDAECAGALIASAADVAVIMDRDGLILDTAFSEADLSNEIGGDWIGRRWVTTVSPDSRQKIEDMLSVATPTASARWRQVNHPTGHGGDIPVRYRIGRFGPNGRLLAVGRDLRPMAALQQRLAEAQQEMEREYIRIRNAEKRYRLLFQLASEAVVILDSNTSRIIEANPAAVTFLGVDPKKLIGQTFEALVTERSRQVWQSFLSATRVAPRVDNVHLQLEPDQRSVLLTGSLYLQERVPHLVVLLSRLSETGGASSNDDVNILRLLEALPEAFVVVDADRKIVTANAAFLDLVQVTNLVQVRGEPIERWIGRQGSEVDVLFSNLRTHGSVRHFSTVARGEFGTVEDVEIVAVSTVVGGATWHGFAIRSDGWRGGREKLGGRELPRTVEQFTELVGRVPMKNLVRETTDLIERLCIQAALELTRENRRSAAEMLGLSRQAFYVKLRRYGLGADAADEDEMQN